MKPDPRRTYTCSDYRDEMRLLALKRRIERERLAEDERLRLEEEIGRLQQRMGID